MMNEWEAYLERSAAEWNLPSNGDWTCLVYNNYQVQCTNLDLLWFHKGGEYPLAVAKLSRDEQVLRREYDNLERAYACAPQWTPKPFAFRKSGPFSQLWMAGVPGRSLSGSSPGRRTLETATTAIAALHEALRKTAAPAAPERRRRMVLDPLATLAAFGDDPAVRDACMELSRTVTEEWVESMPVIPQHGDLFAGNVLVSGDQLHFVDWESFGVVDIPFYDLVTLLLSVLMTSGEQPGVWSPALVELAPALVASYCRRLGLRSEDFVSMFPLAMANWFHLQTMDGRSEFGKRMYKTAGHYFRRSEAWNGVFIGAN